MFISEAYSTIQKMIIIDIFSDSKECFERNA